MSKQRIINIIVTYVSFSRNKYISILQNKRNKV